MTDLAQMCAPAAKHHTPLQIGGLTTTIVDFLAAFWFPAAPTLSRHVVWRVLLVALVRRSRWGGNVE
jgi:hypothetical protein